MNRFALAAALAVLCLPISAQAQPTPGGSLVHGVGGQTPWFKGNTHSHARILVPIPHGDSGPKRMAKWYADRGYNFLCISDHNKVGREQKARSVESSSFILISGSEVTSDSRIRLIYKWKNRSAPKVVIHTTALNINPNGWDTKIWKQFTPQSTPAEILRDHRLAIEGAGGLTILNHPNFKTPLSAQDIINSGISHFEVYSAYPHAKNHGGGSQPSTDELWDQVLSQGVRLYGVASDDAHHTKDRCYQEKLGIHAPPGGGWIMVRSPLLTPDRITAAIQAGDFYASNGVHLSTVDVSAGVLTVAVDEAATRLEIAKDHVSEPARQTSSSQTPNTPRITFITLGGLVLQTVDAAQASVTLSQVTGYVRAKVSWVAGGKGFYAWTQPVFVP